MTQKINRFNLKEVNKIRIVCDQCETVIEIKTGSGARKMDGFCPRCRKDLFENDKVRNIVIGIDNLFEMIKEVDTVQFEMEFAEE